VVNVTATADLLIADYVGLGQWIGLATGQPGSTNAPANEAVGGSPPYTRQETVWTTTGATSIGSPVTFNVGPGTYSFMLMCSGSSGSNMVDWVPITPQVTGVQTTITITPLATAS
jgi:hypothetical protein